MAIHQSQTLELYDLDGTLNEIDVPGALEGNGSAEVKVYLEAAARFVANKIPSLRVEDIFEGIKAGMREVFPNRSKLSHWASFPDAQKNSTRVCPAVDHFLLTPHAIRAYLSTCEEAQEFLASDWQYDLYKFCSTETLPHAEIDDDAKGALSTRLTQEALMVVLTNSAPSKAVEMLTKAGFGDHLLVGGVERGKIGVVGDAKKFEVDLLRNVDHSLGKGTRYGAVLDLGAYFEPGAILQLGRAHYHEIVARLMEQSGARSVWMASDIPELDLWPLHNWEKFNSQLAMRRNPTSSQESINALTGESIPLSISDRLSVLTDALG